MRRFLALIAIPLLACVVLAGCGSSKSSASSSSSSSPSSSSSNSAVTATGSFGKAPTVDIPKAKAGNNLAVKTLIQGTGATLTKSDAMAANFVLYFWDGTSSSLKANTFTSNPTVIGGTMLPGLESALIGQKVGSRVLAVIPPAQGYGTSGNSQLGITGTTTLVFVIDVLKAYSNTAGATGTQVSNGGGTLPTVTAKAGSAPTLTFPSSSPPSGLVTKTLIKGNGPAVVKGELRDRAVCRLHLADQEGLRLLLVVGLAVRLRHRRVARAGHSRLGQGPGRPDRGQPGADLHPAG